MSQTRLEASTSRVIMGIHNLSNKPSDSLSKMSIYGVWNNVVGAKTELQKVRIEFQDIQKTSM